VPHLFSLIGKPHKTQYWVRRIQREAYRPGPYGYCGNEDVGQMSAWFVLTAMGIHQSCVASNRFELNTPLFRKIILPLDPSQHSCRISRTLTLLTDRDPDTHPFIASVEVNGHAIGRSFLTWEELTDGGEILFRLTDRTTTG
jgi:putative alpha-1,2-mannosidase